MNTLINQLNDYLKPNADEDRQTEGNLRESLKLAASILQTVREGLLILDADLYVRMANRSFYQIFQTNPEETNNRLFYEIGNGEWNIPALRSLLEEILPSNTQFNDYEVEHDFSHIGRRTMLLNARRVYQHPSETQVILLSIEDITERKRLEQAVEIYTRKLESSNVELQDFAYIASHDLQEPLRAIQAFGERLMAKHGEALGEEGRDYLQRMQNASSRMRVLIRDLLAYSRVTTKGNAFKTVDLGQVMNSVMADLAPMVEESDGRVEIATLPIVEADPTQMRQLLQNLIANALKFRWVDVPPVVKIFSVDIPPPAESGENNGQAQLCRFVVEDNGIGFDQKYAQRIFAPFERLHNQRQYDGTGIGLAICHKIVERHGGEISAQSEPGQGTRFTIALPRRQPKKEVIS